MTTTHVLRVLALVVLAILLVLPGLVPLPAAAGVVPPVPPPIPPGVADALAVILGGGAPIFFVLVPEGPIESIISPPLPAIGIPPGTFTAFLTEPGTTDISDQIIVASNGTTFTVSLFSDPLVPVTPCVTPSCVAEDGTFQLMNTALGLSPDGPIFIFAFSDIGDRIPDVPGVTPLALVALGLGALGLARIRRTTTASV